MINHLQQLKYGNFVRGIHLDAEYYSVIEIGTERIVLQNPINSKFVTVLKENFYRIEEVELTEKWLLKFGFYKNGGSIFRLNLGKSIIAIGGDGSFGLYNSEFSFNRGNSFNNNYRLNYVHQLQNLVHSLTGEEL